jgi:hypothetical protein
MTSLAQSNPQLCQPVDQQSISFERMVTLIKKTDVRFNNYLCKKFKKERMENFLFIHENKLTEEQRESEEKIFQAEFDKFIKYVQSNKKSNFCGVPLDNHNFNIKINGETMLVDCEKQYKMIEVLEGKTINSIVRFLPAKVSMPIWINLQISKLLKVSPCSIFMDWVMGKDLFSTKDKYSSILGDFPTDNNGKPFTLYDFCNGWEIIESDNYKVGKKTSMLNTFIGGYGLGTIDDPQLIEFKCDGQPDVLSIELVEDEEVPKSKKQKTEK